MEIYKALNAELVGEVQKWKLRTAEYCKEIVLWRSRHLEERKRCVLMKEAYDKKFKHFGCELLKAMDPSVRIHFSCDDDDGDDGNTNNEQKNNDVSHHIGTRATLTSRRSSSEILQELRHSNGVVRERNSIPLSPTRRGRSSGSSSSTENGRRSSLRKSLYTSSPVATVDRNYEETDARNSEYTCDVDENLATITATQLHIDESPKASEDLDDEYVEEEEEDNVESSEEEITQQLTNEPYNHPYELSSILEDDEDEVYSLSESNDSETENLTNLALQRETQTTINIAKPSNKNSNIKLLTNNNDHFSVLDTEEMSTNSSSISSNKNNIVKCTTSLSILDIEETTIVNKQESENNCDISPFRDITNHAIKTNQNKPTKLAKSKAQQMSQNTTNSSSFMEIEQVRLAPNLTVVNVSNVNNMNDNRLTSNKRCSSPRLSQYSISGFGSIPTSTPNKRNDDTNKNKQTLDLMSTTSKTTTTSEVISSTSLSSRPSRSCRPTSFVETKINAKMRNDGGELKKRSSKKK